MDTGLMIIKLRKYNSAEELLIGCRNARLWTVNQSEHGCQERVSDSTKSKEVEAEQGTTGK